MRIAVVAPLPPIRSGIARHSANVVQALKAAGHTVLAYSWAKQYPSLLYRRPEVESGTFGDVNRSLHWAKPWTWVGTGRQIGTSAELLFMPWVTPFHALVVRALMASSRLPTVVLVHNAAPHERFPATKWLTRLVLNRAQGIVAHSAIVVSDLRRFGITVPASVVPLPSTIELRALPIPSSPPIRLLFLGFVRYYKGLDLLVRALDLLPDEVTLTVAGEFWGTRTETERLVADLGLGRRVEIIDRYLADDEVAMLLRSHHIVVAPYRTATQSGIVPLAFAAGRPVVATAVGGLVEAVANHHNGVICAPNPESIAGAVHEAMSEYDDLARGATTTVWSWADVAERILESAMPA